MKFIQSKDYFKGKKHGQVLNVPKFFGNKKEVTVQFFAWTGFEANRLCGQEYIQSLIGLILDSQMNLTAAEIRSITEFLQSAAGSAVPSESAVTQVVELMSDLFRKAETAGEPGIFEIQQDLRHLNRKIPIARS